MSEETLVVEGGPLSFEEGLRVALMTSANRDGGTPASFLETLAKVIEERAWERLTDPDGNTLTLHRVLFDDPPIGAGLNQDDFWRLIRLRHRWERTNQNLHERIERARKEAHDLLLPDLPRRGGKREQSNNITPARGTGEDYARRRLRRDRPDLYQQVVDGELSAHAAALEAGFRRPQTTVFIDSPAAAVAALLRRFSRAELQAALEETPDP